MHLVSHAVAKGASVTTRRVAMAAEPLMTSDDFDYADAFEAQVRDPDDRAAEWWARAGLEGAPGWMRAVILIAHRRVLRFRPAPPPTHEILGWQVTVSEPDVVRLDTDGPLLQATLIARRTTPTVARVSTYLRFRHPAARPLWFAVGPLHRAFVPRLLRHAAMSNR